MLRPKRKILRRRWERTCPKVENLESREMLTVAVTWTGQDSLFRNQAERVQRSAAQADIRRGSLDAKDSSKSSRDHAAKDRSDQSDQTKDAGTHDRTERNRRALGRVRHDRKDILEQVDSVRSGGTVTSTALPEISRGEVVALNQTSLPRMVTELPVQNATNAEVLSLPLREAIANRVSERRAALQERISSFEPTTSATQSVSVSSPAREPSSVGPFESGPFLTRTTVAPTGDAPRERLATATATTPLGDATAVTATPSEVVESSANNSLVSTSDPEGLNWSPSQTHSDGVTLGEVGRDSTNAFDASSSIADSQGNAATSNSATSNSATLPWSSAAASDDFDELHLMDLQDADALRGALTTKWVQDARGGPVEEAAPKNAGHLDSDTSDDVLPLVEAVYASWEASAEEGAFITLPHDAEDWSQPMAVADGASYFDVEQLTLAHLATIPLAVDLPIATSQVFEFADADGEVMEFGDVAHQEMPTDSAEPRRAYSSWVLSAVAGAVLHLHWRQRRPHSNQKKTAQRNSGMRGGSLQTPDS